jgi:hypothetical protein
MRAFDFDASRALAMSPELGKYRYVHFATHTIINNAHPGLSGIVLSLVERDGAEQDGFLRAYEIFNLDLPVEMVVLSACSSGLGQQVAGEGLVGMTRGFFYAGAARVVVSLWDVNDQATAELMKRMYRAILGKARTRPPRCERLRSRCGENPDGSRLTFGQRSRFKVNGGDAPFVRLSLSSGSFGQIVNQLGGNSTGGLCVFQF